MPILGIEHPDRDKHERRVGFLHLHETGAQQVIAVPKILGSTAPKRKPNICSLQTPLAIDGLVQQTVAFFGCIHIQHAHLRFVTTKNQTERSCFADTCTAANTMLVAKIPVRPYEENSKEGRKYGLRRSRTPILPAFTAWESSSSRMREAR